LGKPDRTVTFYTIKDLGTLGGSYSNARAINAAGQVVGDAATDGDHHAFLYSDGKMTDLGTVPDLFRYSALCINAKGQVAFYAVGAGERRYTFFYRDGTMTDVGSLGGSTWPRAINDSGQLVCNAHTADGKARAFLYSQEKMVVLGTLPGGSSCTANGMNASGQVVGLADSRNCARAFLYSNEKMTDLGTLGGLASVGYAINAKGEVTGDAETASGIGHAFLYRDGKMTDLGTLGGEGSYGLFITDRGVVVGRSHTADGSQRAFLYANGKMVDLGALPGSNYSNPQGVNAQGQVVGWSSPLSAPPGFHGAFLYSNGKMHDLNKLIPSDSGWTILSVKAINDSGEIIGQGKSPGGDEHAILLKPVH
jgi:probable HAF family extracellular repeat protein